VINILLIFALMLFSVLMFLLSVLMKFLTFKPDLVRFNYFLFNLHNKSWHSLDVWRYCTNFDLFSLLLY